LTDCSALSHLHWDDHGRFLRAWLPCCCGALQALQLLLVCGADTHVANAYGHTPLALAHKGSAVRQCLQELQDRGPEARQRLQATIKLRQQQSMAARDGAALAAQAE
jgi:hypothetical protein